MKLIKQHPMGYDIVWENIIIVPKAIEVELRTQDGHFIFSCSMQQFKKIKQEPMEKGAFKWLLTEE